MPLKVLVVDVGGNNVKLLATGQREPRKIPSGPALTARRMVAAVKLATADWAYDAVSPARSGRDSRRASRSTSVAAGPASTTRGPSAGPFASSTTR
jgi:hypothetical protein